MAEIVVSIILGVVVTLAMVKRLPMAPNYSDN